MEPKPCPFCGATPVIHHKKGGASYVKDNKSVIAPYFKVECVSDACSMREVRTHACGSREAAIEVWNA